MTQVQPDSSADQIERIVSFLGYGRYGRPCASVWFVGIEEGLGKMDSEDAIKNLEARSSFGSTMDLYKAHLLLRENGESIDFEERLPTTQVWKFMAKIMRAHEGHQNWADPKSANAYIISRLGRSVGDTFMTEQSPIPASNGADKKWIDMFREKDRQVDDKIWKRKSELKRILEKEAPPLVICYGSRADEFRELLGVEWESRGPKVCRSRDSKRLLLPFFGQGRMSNSIIEDLPRSGLLGPDTRNNPLGGGTHPR